MLALIYLSIIATLTVTILVVALRPIAIRLKLVDKPAGRKTHKGEVPLIGGPVIWVVFTVGLLVLNSSPPWSIIAAAALLVILGIVDDRWPVPARLKLLFHFLAASIVVTGNGSVIADIGIFPVAFGSEEAHFLHVLTAVLAITIAINAFNFIDGIDGLSASMALLALTHANLAFNLMYGSTPPDYAQFNVLFAGSLAGFLLFNLQVFNGRKIFLGDSGSMLVGLMVAITLIDASQSEMRAGPTLPASLCLWLIAIPLTDLTTIIISRLSRRRSPMAADRTHLHHRIMEAGFSARRTLLVMILTSVGAFWIGYAVTTQMGELASIIAFFVFIPAFYWTSLRIVFLLKALND
ncbi:undecaprenyl/decaprenyl-phosphate alpha-N-acetylglucosaminyl 1-phosphate transferase [Alphaproteobacteria bacterium]|nr:undecaprenyl/decaprenyl-phosphate alpha-N-acetylglucosaminyl 1-phosphate transferase [Alphaproteobacteria bacterium]MDB2641252.1 undecaprenyl/decaprenyl-phosphate alpha-N-acetylglucosaminyl 1-phosphate transferase [Alphaproteobacteria bacterium]